MITVEIRQAKSHLGEYLRKVRAGERVVITERGKPIAEITKPRSAADERLEGMIREGLATWGAASQEAQRNASKLRGTPFQKPSSRNAVEVVSRHECPNKALRR